MKNKTQQNAAPAKIDRSAYVESVKADVNSGEYVTDDRLSIALDRMIDAAQLTTKEPKNGN